MRVAAVLRKSCGVQWAKGFPAIRELRIRLATSQPWKPVSNRQHYLLVVNFIPAQLRNLVGALCRQHQQLKDRSVVVIWARLPNGSQLLVGQYAVARPLLPLIRVAGDIAFRQADAFSDDPTE